MKKLYPWILGVVVVVAGVWYVAGQKASPTPTQSPTPSMQMSVSPTPKPTTSRTPVPTVAAHTPSPTPTAGIIIHEQQVFTVKIENFAFAPVSVTVNRGDVVVFKNMDSAPHTATSLTGKFDTGTLAQGQQATVATANLAPGTYEYDCTIHPSMRGTIIVQ